MAKSSRWERYAGYWRTVPLSAHIMLMAGIFFLFTSFGLVMGFVNRTWVYLSWTLGFALAIGFFSMLWAFAGFRRIIWLLVSILPLQLAAFHLLDRTMKKSVPVYGQMEFSREIVTHKLLLEGYFGMFSILLGYVLVVGFIRREGLRVFAVTAEVKLAAEVHQALVPLVSHRLPGYEIYGASVPSGQVGGDLVDVGQDGSQWIAYVADVSGHGVPAGMIMAMVKSATRMWHSPGAGLRGLLADLNRVLQSVSAPNVFVTFACIAGDEDGHLRFALAGHLPVLHYRRHLHTVEERVVRNLPLAVLPDAQFEDASIDCDEGDLLAILTDGLTEAANKSGEELGLGPLKEVLLKKADIPLEQISSALRERSLQQGKQMDDQTVLLVRRILTG
ncbi:MAG TPA: PP2C family protein-serine/threonine phosphatase [Candidatus Angelobacter sp.]|nr:PP2C family protein-serine/threonine phosphatase [Candidatus Angelobacter sp.]